MLKSVLATCCLFLLTACAPALQGAEMMPSSAVYDSLDTNTRLQHNISLGSVVADKGLGGGTAPVTSEQYQAALTLALRQVGWYAREGTGRYRLDAHLHEIDQPIIGFNFTVNSKAEYTLTDKTSGRVRYNDDLSLPCTVLYSEAPIADIRIRKATACAVSENITHLLRVLSTHR